MPFITGVVGLEKGTFLFDLTGVVSQLIRVLSFVCIFLAVHQLPENAGAVAHHVRRDDSVPDAWGHERASRAARGPHELNADCGERGRYSHQPSAKIGDIA